ncbi:MAG: glyoxalase, partial [Nonomuraea sp.]|nr:glyoxalase [Nonomuraea sp.]
TYLPDWEKPTGNARTSLCFAFKTPEGVDAAYDDITGAGYGSAAKPFDAFWGMRYAVVLDPDGNGVHLYCPTS